MSSVYVFEPPTKGKVILTTNYGPLVVELSPKEAPKAVRNFVQLCLEGYNYDNAIFHRIIKSFLIQGGDPTGTGKEEEKKELANVKTKIKSSHDVLHDPHLLKEKSHSSDLNPSEVKLRRDTQLTVREALSSNREELHRKPDAEFSEALDDSADNEANFDAQMRQQIPSKRKELGDLPTKMKSHKDSVSLGNREASPPRSPTERKDDRPIVEKLSLKKKGLGSEARAELMANADADFQLLGNAERERRCRSKKGADAKDMKKC